MPNLLPILKGVSVSKESFAVCDNRIYREGYIINLVPHNKIITGYTGRILDFIKNNNERTSYLTAMRLDCSSCGHMCIERFNDSDISAMYKIELHSN